MALKDTSIWDKNSFINNYSSIKNFLLKKTVTGNIVINLWRARKAAVNNLTDKFYDLKKAKGNEVKYDSVYEKSELMKQEEFLPAFRKRVNQLVDTCEKYKIIPVLITQPCMLGKGIDAVSGADLALVPATKNANGELFNQMLEMYNDVTRSVGRNRNVVVIDLAEKLEKGGGYFYDILHFNLEGNRRVAEIITISMDSLLKVQFKTYLKKP